MCRRQYARSTAGELRGVEENEFDVFFFHCLILVAFFHSLDSTTHAPFLLTRPKRWQVAVQAMAGGCPSDAADGPREDSTECLQL